MQTTVYTDGSALRNPHGPAAWAYWISDAIWAAGGFTKASNQRAELYAVLAVLRAAPADADLLIRTDSQYTIDCLTKWIANWRRNGWKNRAGQPVVNQKEIVAIDGLIRSRTGSVKFEKVKGHSGDHGNDRADALCGAVTDALDKGLPVAAGPGWGPR